MQKTDPQPKQSCCSCGCLVLVVLMLIPMCSPPSQSFHNDELNNLYEAAAQEVGTKAFLATVGQSMEELGDITASMAQFMDTSGLPPLPTQLDQADKTAQKLIKLGSTPNLHSSLLPLANSCKRCGECASELFSFLRSPTTSEEFYQRLTALNQELIVVSIEVDTLRDNTQ